MDRFHIIEEATVIIFRCGVYRQAKVFRRGEYLYAGVGSGFVRLYGGNGTSAPKTAWMDIEGDGIVVDGAKAPRWAPQTKRAAA